MSEVGKYEVRVACLCAERSEGGEGEAGCDERSESQEQRDVDNIDVHRKDATKNRIKAREQALHNDPGARCQEEGLHRGEP